VKIYDLIQRYSDLCSKIYVHPFNQGLHKGDLAKPVFRLFLEQDGLYLRDFDRALNIVEQRLDKEMHAPHFRSFSENTILFEREIQLKYLKELPVVSFFNEKRKPLQKIPVIGEYTEHLLDSASNGSIAEAVTCFIPCFLVYKELGEQMNLVSCNPEHPYREWIASYSDEQFKVSTATIISIADDLIKDIDCPQQQEKIADSFWKSLHYEYRFFDEILFPEKSAIQSLAYF
jgi:thiaminase/transcriptional activator TenA